MVHATPTPIMPDLGTSTRFRPKTLSVVKATMVKMKSMDRDPHATRAAAFASTTGSLASPRIVPRALDGADSLGICPLIRCAIAGPEKRTNFISTPAALEHARSTQSRRFVATQTPQGAFMASSAAPFAAPFAVRGTLATNPGRRPSRAGAHRRSRGSRAPRAAVAAPAVSWPDGTGRAELGGVVAEASVVNLGKRGEIATGLPFLDHMIDQLTSHCQLGVSVVVTKDGVPCVPCVDASGDDDETVAVTAGFALGRAGGVGRGGGVAALVILLAVGLACGFALLELGRRCGRGGGGAKVASREGRRGREARGPSAKARGGAKDGADADEQDETSSEQGLLEQSGA